MKELLSTTVLSKAFSSVQYRAEYARSNTRDNSKSP